jgi:N-methylhydantoinase A
MARELGIPTVLVPARPGITNALGCVVADLRHDYVRTVNKPLSAIDDATVSGIYAEQAAEGRRTIVKEGVPVRELRRVLSADMQFQGQSHILTVAISDLNISRDELRKAFEAAYWQRFQVELSEIRPVLVNLHTAVIGKRKPVLLKSIAAATPKATLREAQISSRKVWFEGGWSDTPVYRRELLPEGAQLTGPAILEQLDCTTVIEPGNQAQLDAIGNLIISL